MTTKNVIKSTFLVALAIAGIAMSSSCSDDNTTDNTQTGNMALAAVLQQYVEGTVTPTYTHLADASLRLDSMCKVLYDKKQNQTATQADVKSVCAAWISARKYWEQSEAFLLGPATIKGIDPHIDSWPLDKTALDKLLSNEQVMADIDASYITTNYGSGGLCGFHALEYVVFADGTDRAVSEITTGLSKYAYAVSGDLALQCVYLETAWKGVNQVSDVKKKMLEDADYVSDEDTNNWGQHFIHAGEAGSRYRTKMAAIVDFIKADKACFGIANEVGDTKISDPVGSQNVLDVESWYSWNSKADFQDNIRGIQNVIMGGVSGSRNESLSIYHYLAQKNPVLAAQLKTAIETCIGEDGSTGLGTIVYPFRNNLEPTKNKTAIEACQALRDKLAEVAAYLQELK